MTVKGRHWVALWLAFVLATLVWVQSRQTSSHLLAGELRELREDRAAFESEKADQSGRVRSLRSRSVLIPRAESLGLRLPVDSEIVFLEFSGGRR